MVLIGLTGGVGMGKSTAARSLLDRGVPVVDTDKLAHDLVEPGLPALGEIEQTFGPQVIGPGGRLLRAEMARIVFGDPVARQKLEAILHPRIRAAWQEQAAQWRREGLRAGCVVIPLLYETGAEAEFDRIVCVGCSEWSQKDRLRERGWSDDEIQRRNEAQLPIAQKLLRADYVIWTEGDRSLIGDQWDLILSKAARV